MLFGVDPLLLAIPTALGASCAFMMPVATPPNAIIFGSGRIRVADMARVGLFINLIGVLVISAIFFVLGLWVFQIDPTVTPGWALTAATAVR